jgi:hypothetical protein
MRVEMMKKIYMFIFLLYLNNVFGCQLTNTSSWYWDKLKLIKETENIYIAKVISVYEERRITRSPFTTEYVFSVLKTVKGKGIEKFSITGGHPLKKKLDKNTSYHKNCKLLSRFTKGNIYLIFKDSFHPDGYKRIVLDDWLRFTYENL